VDSIAPANALAWPLLYKALSTEVHMIKRLLPILVIVLLLAPASFARASGPHFMAEGGLGLMTGLSGSDTTDFGSSGGVVLGIGGRPAGSWLRCYLITEALFGTYGREIDQNLRVLNLDRNLFEFGLGGRVVAPLTRSIRLFADAEVVGVRTATTFSGSHLATTDSAELDLGFRFASGLQVRPMEMMSVGLRFSLTVALDDLDGDAQTGWLADFDSEAGHAEASLQLTFYF